MRAHSLLFFVFLGSAILLSTDGCSTQHAQSDYDSVFQNAALVLELKLVGLNPADTELLRAKFVGQSMESVVAGLEVARKRAPRNVVVEWASRTGRIEIRVGTELVDERMAYGVTVFLDQDGIARDISWRTVSLPLNTGSYLGKAQ